MSGNAMGRRPSITVRHGLARVREAVSDFAAKSTSRFAILVFSFLIFVFTMLFSLPIASADRQVTPIADALFTAVSVICVTGLSTVDMATHWSLFGHVLVFIGVQIGALGVLTLASILGFVIEGLLWLAVVGLVLFAATVAWGWLKRRTKSAR